MSRLQDQLTKLKFASEQGVKELKNNKYKSYSEILNSSYVYIKELNQYSDEVITVVLPNSIDYIEVMIACFLTGNIFNPIPYFTSNKEITRICDYIQPAVVITDKEELIDAAELGTVRLLKHMDTAHESTLSKGEYRSVSGDQVASLYYSSGTTGSPKGVLYSHDNIYYLIGSINRGFGFDENTRHLTLLPFGHTASINYNLLPCLFKASPLVVAENFSSIAPMFFKIISDEKINYTQLVPTIVFMLLKIKYNCDNLDFSDLMFIGCGSSIMPLEAQLKFKDLYGISIGNLYGLSETGPTHIDDPRRPGWKPGTIGVPLDVNECQITTDSELLIKGKNVFVGYYKNEGLYNEVVKDGWFQTGDIVSFLNGVYQYKDRKKDIIIKGAINIVPGEIEEIIYKNSAVHEAIVVGVPDNVYGEEVVAAVTLKDKTYDKEVLKKQLSELLKNNLSSYKHPVDYVFFDEFPKTHSGKLIRREVKKLVIQ